jgi:mxaJ protein
MKWRRCFSVVISAASMMMGAVAADAAVLRVCADPNNLPFSDQAGRGFENEIIALIARDLGSTVEYTWWAQRRGYVRNTLKADVCDVWSGVASGAEMMTSTRPYYRSSYVFVTRADRGLHIASLDDPQLRKLVIGVQMVGSDAMNTPPAHALARRGIVQNVRGYMLYGDYREPHPSSATIGPLEVSCVGGWQQARLEPRLLKPMRRFERCDFLFLQKSRGDRIAAIEQIVPPKRIYGEIDARAVFQQNGLLWQANPQ